MIHIKNFLRLILFITSMHAGTVAFAAATLDSIVAVVNDSVITQSQLNQQMVIARRQIQGSGGALPAANVLRKQVLDQLIDIALQKQLAKSAGIEVSEENLTQAIEGIAKKNGITLGQLREKIQEQGMSYAQYRNEIRDQILVSEVQRRELAQNITVTDQEIDDLLSTAQLPNLPAAEYQIQDLLVPLPASADANKLVAAKQLAAELKAQLQNGDKLSDVLKAGIAKDPEVQGADLGWRKSAEIPEGFLAVIKDVKTGGVVGPVSADNGLHIIRVVATKGEPGVQGLTQYRVRHILLKTNAVFSDQQARERLLKLRSDIVNGAKFASVAEVNSQDPGSAGKGGDIGWVSSDMLDAAFANVISQLKIGQISMPFKSQFGWHLAKVLEKRVVNNTQEVKRNLVREQVFKRKADEAVKVWLKQLRNQSYIKILKD